jgi:hypothetical protein
MIHGSLQKWRKSISKKYPGALVKENKECIKKLHKNAKRQKPVST